MIGWAIFVMTLFSLFSTAIMSFIAMATPIGPWVGPMLTLISIVIFRSIQNPEKQARTIIWCVTGGSVGGIVAIAFGSSFPTLYFLDKPLFLEWMSRPLYFICLMGLIGLAAGLYGFLIATVLEQKFFEQDNLPFPIGQLMYSTISSVQGNLKKAWEMFGGFFGTLFICLLQTLKLTKTFIPSAIRLLPKITLGCVTIPELQLRLDIFPMLWAIGFITGSGIAIPLAVGALSKIFIVDPINCCFFTSLCSWDFSIAFCSGLVTISSLLGFTSLPRLIKNAIQGLKKKESSEIIIRQRATITHLVPLIVLVGVILALFFWFFHFSVIAALYLTIATFFTTYVMAGIAGKIGLAQLGRFATFVMVPAMFLFGINPVHLTVIATFVEITGGVASDILFGRKLAHSAHISSQSIAMWQLAGLILSCAAVGIIFWLLINHFGIGSDILVAQRAQARALLITMKSFNIWVLGLGALYGLGLKKCGLNPLLVFGGLLMPLPYSLGLILGGFSTYLVKNTTAWEPFCSGVFAANSLWEVVKAVATL